jgi:hypothetical protein
MLKAPFRLPPDFLTAFGYPGNRRFVAIYWEPCGDEAAYEDGVSSAVGIANNWLYLNFIHQLEVFAWIEANHLNLGNSDQSAQHWWLADRLTGDLYAGTRREIYSILLRQQLPEEDATP